MGLTLAADVTWGSSACERNEICRDRLASAIQIIQIIIGATQRKIQQSAKSFIALGARSAKLDTEKKQISLHDVRKMNLLELEARRALVGFWPVEFTKILKFSKKSNQRIVERAFYRAIHLVSKGRDLIQNVLRFFYGGLYLFKELPSICSEYHHPISDISFEMCVKRRVDETKDEEDHALVKAVGATLCKNWHEFTN